MKYVEGEGLMMGVKNLGGIGSACTFGLLEPATY
jgi:hypothetical protein